MLTIIRQCGELRIRPTILQDVDFDQFRFIKLFEERKCIVQNVEKKSMLVQNAVIHVVLKL